MKQPAITPINSINDYTVSNFLCHICGVELKNRGHVCGTLDGPHKVEIVGGGSWGRSDFSPGGTRDKSTTVGK